MPKLQRLQSRLEAVAPKQVKQHAGFRREYQKLYDHDWRKVRGRFLKSNPLCVYCKDRFNRVTAANVVDHIIPHKGNKTLFWDESNWQPLCRNCHDSVKAKEEIKQGYM